MIPKTMGAMVLTGHGGPETLEWHEDWPVPEPGPDDLLVKVGACGLNNTDINTRVGWYSKAVTGATEEGGASPDEDPSWGGAAIAFPRIQGADICGEVVAAGANADPALVGRRVIADCWLRDWDDPEAADGVGYYGSERDGGFAEYATVDRRNAAAIESDLSDAELATFSCSYTTAENMLARAGVAEGDRVLVTGASGGVGSALLQLIRRRGAEAIALASEAKHAELAPLGATLLPRSPANLPAALKDATGHEDVTVVADVVGGAGFPALIDALARRGRYVVSGAIAGPIVDLDLRTLYLRDLTFLGSTVTALHVFADLVGYIERGEVRPLLAGTYPLKRLREAQAAFADKRHVGNIVVVP